MEETTRNLNFSLEQEKGFTGLIVCIFWLCAAYYLVCQITRRLPFLQARPGDRRQKISGPRLQVLVALCVGMLYVSGRLILVMGLKTDMTMARCQASKWMTLCMFGLFKICAVVFLTERVHIVHNAAYTLDHWYDRFRSKWFCGACIICLCWLAEAGIIMNGMSAMVIGGQCMYTLTNLVTVSFIVLDVAGQLYLVAAFTVPLFGTQSYEAKKMAKISLCGSLVSMMSILGCALPFVVTSTGGLGMENSIITDISCTVDILVNATVLCALTRRTTREDDLSAPAAVAEKPKRARKPLPVKSLDMFSFLQSRNDGSERLASQTADSQTESVRLPSYKSPVTRSVKFPAEPESSESSAKDLEKGESRHHLEKGESRHEEEEACAKLEETGKSDNER